MKLWIGLALAGILAGSAAVWIRMGSDRTVSQGIDRQIQSAPLFELKDFAGKTVSLDSLKGNLIVLHFWAAWCPPCLDEIPDLIAAAKKYHDKPVKWVAVSLDPSWDDAHKILPEKDLPPGMISLLDPTNQVNDRYGTYQFPESYLISPDLKILAKWVGPQKWNDPGVGQVLDQVTQAMSNRGGVSAEKSR